MIIDPTKISRKDGYKIATGTILPRPIAWVSTIDENGVPNLAPYSFFTVASSQPLTLLFCPQYHADTGQPKDTLRNIEKIPEFVVNLTNEETAEAMNTSSAPLPSGKSEFALAGLTAAPCETVRVPRVAEAPVSYECHLHQIVTIRDGNAGGATVFGRVTRIHIRDDIYQDGYINLQVLKPIGRLAGSGYARITDLFDMVRPDPSYYQEWKNE